METPVLHFSNPLRIWMFLISVCAISFQTSTNCCVRGSTWREKVTLAFSNTTWVRWLNKVPSQCLTLSIQKLQKYLRFCIGAPGQRNTEYWYRVFKVTAAPTSSAGWITWFAWSTASNIKWFNDDDIITWYDGHYNGSLPIPIVHFFNMVKVSWQSDARKYQNKLSLLTLTNWVKRTRPLWGQNMLSWAYICLAVSFGAMLVGWLVVVARGLYLVRHLYTLLDQVNYEYTALWF